MFMEKWLRSTALRMLYSRERLIPAMQDRTPTNAILPENLFRPCGSHAGTMRGPCGPALHDTYSKKYENEYMRSVLKIKEEIVGGDKYRQL